MKEIQQEWKNAGYTPAKISESLYERYRSACNKIFEARNTYFGKINEERKANKKLKMEIIRKVKELKDSSNGKEAKQEITKPSRDVILHVRP